jgi:hypothetical protein
MVHDRFMANVHPNGAEPMSGNDLGSTAYDARYYQSRTAVRRDPIDFAAFQK